jgi:hypothetical protein
MLVCVQLDGPFDVRLVEARGFAVGAPAQLQTAPAALLPRYAACMPLLFLFSLPASLLAESFGGSEMRWLRRVCVRVGLAS